MSKGEIVGKFGLWLSLMSKVFTNDKGITSGYDGRTNSVKTKVMMTWHGIVEDVG